LQGIQEFVASNEQALKDVQQRIRQTQKSKVEYPLMKIVDMYFWQTGFETAKRGNI
jgi:hypothetical protein